VHPGKKLDLADLRTGFGRIGFRPGLVRDVVKAMSAEGITEVGRGINHCMASDQQSAVWRALLREPGVTGAWGHTGAWGQVLFCNIAMQDLTPSPVSQCKT
jgi:hypothetical protein